MTEPHVVSALIAKRAELAGALEEAQSEVRRLIMLLDSVDATIRIYKPDIDLEEIRPKPLPPRYIAYKGEMARIIFTQMRDTRHPLTADELTVHMMTERNLNPADRPLYRGMNKRIHAFLRHYRNRGLIASERAPGRRMLWRLV